MRKNSGLFGNLVFFGGFWGFKGFLGLEIQKIEIGENDKFLIIGSDGVWEIIDNYEVEMNFFLIFINFHGFLKKIKCVQLIAKYYAKNELEKAADALMEEVLSRWKKVLFISKKN